MNFEEDQANNYSNFQIQEKGITGWLISKNIVSDKKGANKILIGVFIVATILTLSIFFRDSVSSVVPGNNNIGIPPEESEEGFFPQS
ncbi:MAG: hypothetical protein ACI9GH_000575 [Candidatus Paceibacteria bacterium]|jgi:hypothetical protein